MRVLHLSVGSLVTGVVVVVMVLVVPFTSLTTSPLLAATLAAVAASTTPMSATAKNRRFKMSSLFLITRAAVYF